MNLRKTCIAVSKVLPMLFFFSVSCGPETNIFGYLHTDEHKEQFYILIGTAKAEFDAGNYDAAVEAGEKAWALNPGNEEASITLGFAYLGKAGIAPISLARKLIEGNNSEESDDSTSGVLSGLAPVLGVSRSSVEKLGDLDTVTDPELPLLIPYCASKARTSLENLESLNKAIEVICPFVSESVRLEEDYRHVCTKTEKVQAMQGKADFLWAFAHLTEAIAFDKVINYSTTSSSSTNLELRMDAIDSRVVTTAGEITSFIAEVDSLKQAVDKILPVDGVCEGDTPQTQFQGMLNDLIATTLAFNAIPGIPESFTESLTASMAGILELRDKANSGVGDSSDQSNALKGDLTGAIAKTLADKIDEVDGDTGLTPDQLAQICASYDSISGGSEEGRPVACSGL